MKVEKALEILKEQKLLTPLGQAIYVAIEALEKQVPKKMNDEKDFGECCPICRTAFAGGLYCRTCGQKLDLRVE